jgi:hypothetical protein
MDTKLSKQQELENTKRLSFDREQRIEISNTTVEYVYDEEELITDWERVYTGCSIIDIDHAPTKLRFGTGDKAKIKWHVEEPSPVADVVYTVCEEFHARQHNLGVFGIYGAGQADHIVVVWHGYDKRIRER